MFEKWRENLDKGGKCGALFVNETEVLDWLLHSLLQADLDAYELDNRSIDLI